MQTEVPVVTNRGRPSYEVDIVIIVLNPPQLGKNKLPVRQVQSYLCTTDL